jgi:predicted solute-binding protein
LPSSARKFNSHFYHIILKLTIPSLLHAITASFHEIKEHRNKNRIDHEKAVHEQHVAAADGHVQH